MEFATNRLLHLEVVLIVRAVLLFVLLVLLLVPVGHATNVTLNYVWNSTHWVPQLATSDGKPKVDIDFANLTTGNLSISGTGRGILFADGTFLSRATDVSPWIRSGSSLYYNDGNVGVGTAFPSRRLEIVGGDLNVSGGNLTVSGGVAFPGLAAIRLLTTTAGGALATSVTSAGAAASLSDETGTGSLVFANAPTLSSPRIALLYGGTSASSTLSLRSTTGNGSTDAIVFGVGSNGATEAMRIVNGGRVGIGVSSPSDRLSVAGNLSFNGTATGIRFGDGSFQTRSANVDVRVFAGNGTWTKPSEAKWIRVIAIGGGGGGGGGSNGGDGAGGGGGGAYVMRDFDAGIVGPTVAVTVGLGGSGGTGGNGTAGGNSSFGSHLTAYGGANGAYYHEGGGGGGSGSPGLRNSGGNPNLSGAGNNNLGGGGGDGGSGNAVQGGSAEYGGGGGAGASTAGNGGPGNAGGSSVFGPGGGGGGAAGQFNDTNGVGGLGGRTGSYEIGGGGAGGMYQGGGGAGTSRSGGRSGDGGGGGGYGGDGGDAGIPGGGGGGGGKGSGSTSRGGDGGRGEVIVITWF